MAFIYGFDKRWKAQNNSEPFYDKPQPIAKTILVAIAWPEGGQVLFPNNQFSWGKIAQAMEVGNWEKIGGKPQWGSFDFLTTNPTRSNSGQLTLSLWALEEIGGTILSSKSLNNSSVKSLFSLVKRSVYLPPRSTDILLQEFIAKGENDADIATVYESIALHRWEQSRTTQGQPYQIYYLNPTIETVSTAAIARRDVSSGMVSAARKFIDFLRQSEQQILFVKYGFRPVDESLDLQNLPNSPWSQSIPGAKVNPGVKTMSTPDA
ncbi:MAG: substrate-binding domain-containing protein, partial [Trichodesmium sp.]